MPLGVRIFLVYFLFVGLTGYFVLSTVMDEVRPGVRQSTEETLVDTANLLAEILRQDVKNGTLAQSDLPEMLEDYGKRVPQADIWGLRKEAVNHRIYVTDASGKVLLDSAGVAVGQDYSRWNDVYLTLRGQYGARSSREDPDDPDSSVMYVAAPIKDAGKIIGVVSVAKPNSSLQPYIDRSQRRLAWLGAGLIALGLLVGGLLSWWLSGALRRLTQYAQAVSEGRRAELPRYRGGEMAQLADAVERMRTQLEGKDYVERYVHTLTHELKSPLAAIRGAAELLDGEMPAEQRARFVGNIAGESERLQQLIERLLSLAQVEQRQGLEEVGKVDLRRSPRPCWKARRRVSSASDCGWRIAWKVPARFAASSSCCARRWPTCSTTPSTLPRPAASFACSPRPTARVSPCACSTRGRRFPTTPWRASPNASTRCRARPAGARAPGWD